MYLSGMYKNDRLRDDGTLRRSLTCFYLIEAGQYGAHVQGVKNICILEYFHYKYSFVSGLDWTGLLRWALQQFITVNSYLRLGLDIYITDCTYYKSTASGANK